MEAAVAEENCQRALKAVKRNRGAGGIDRMTTEELEPHLQAHVDTQRQNSEGDLRSDACEAGRDTQAERGNADAGNPDGARSIQTAVAAAGADADLRTIQRV